MYFKIHFFKDVIYKKNIIYIFVISTFINMCDLKPNSPEILLHISWNNLEYTWNFMSSEKWKPCLLYVPVIINA